MNTQTGLQRERLLTGDRTTGKLHLGHYVGSLQNRVQMQAAYDTFIMLADVQALTTHFDRPQEMSHHLRQVVEDYLAVGLDPNQATFFVQSMVPELAELTMYYSMFVTVNSLRHNPTIKTELADRGESTLYYGFLGYPVSQAADITAFQATAVPVGEDQVPHIEQTRKIVRRFNQLYRPVLQEPRAIVGNVPRLVGLDGKAKMSKSLGNAIPLDAAKDEVDEKIQAAVTDPARVRKSDPGHPEVCPIFAYHQAFSDADTTAEIELACRAGQLGCRECKAAMAARLNRLLDPMRDRRAAVRRQPQQIDSLLIEGTRQARAVAAETVGQVREAIGIDYFH